MVCPIRARREIHSWQKPGYRHFFIFIRSLWMTLKDLVPKFSTVFSACWPDHDEVIHFEWLLHTNFFLRSIYFFSSGLSHLELQKHYFNEWNILKNTIEIIKIKIKKMYKTQAVYNLVCDYRTLSCL